MKTKSFLIVIPLLMAQLAAAQIDTIDTFYPYYYPRYQLDGFFDYDTAENCKMDIMLHSSIDDVYNKYIGYVAERDMDILGMAQFAFTQGDTANGYWNYLHLASPESIHYGKHTMVLATLSNSELQIQRRLFYYKEDIERTKVLRTRCNSCTSTNHDQYYCDYLMEWWFDSAFHVSAGDTFYMATGEVDSVNSTPDFTFFIEFLMRAHEIHPSGDYSTQHFPDFLYTALRVHDWQNNIETVNGSINEIPFLWAIVRFPEDTCSVPQPYAERLTDNAVFVRWDNNANHAAAEFSFGPAGIAPDDGTIVQSPIPQHVFGNLDPDHHYTVYARARCDFARSEWTGWSAPLDIHLASMEGIENSASPTLTLSPNPANDEIRVKCSHTMQSVALYAADGTTALSIHPNATETAIDLHRLPAGAYTVVTDTAAGTAIKSLVKQ